MASDYQGADYFAQAYSDERDEGCHKYVDGQHAAKAALRLREVVYDSRGIDYEHASMRVCDSVGKQVTDLVRLSELAQLATLRQCLERTLADVGQAQFEAWASRVEAEAMRQGVRGTCPDVVYFRVNAVFEGHLKAANLLQRVRA